MASSKKPKENTSKKKSNSTPVSKVIKKPIKKPDKKVTPTKMPNKSKPDKKVTPTKKPNKSKPETTPKPKPNRNKSSNGTLVESEVIAEPSSSTESREKEHQNKTNTKVKPNKRKQKEKMEEIDEEEDDEKMCRFPMRRIKRIIKSEDPRMAVSKDVVFLVNKATEKFLQQFCEEGYKCSVKDRKKSLAYKHLSAVVRDRSRYDFLSDYVPEKIKAEDALKERNSSEPGAV